MKVVSPAKINLMLRILGQREDGYHLLQTYFQLLDWGDYMNFHATTADKIKISGDFNNLALTDNLIYKAAKLLMPFNKRNSGIEIHVRKNIPQGSGLGGGSSNAGTTLRILNTIWECNLPQTQLKQMAIKLGADVPLFVLNKSAMATGIGEELTALEIDHYYFVLIFPDISIATTDVFLDQSLVRNQKALGIRAVDNTSNWTNACLQPVLNKYPEVNNIYNKAAKLTTIYMSGTGSTLFARFKKKIQADDFIQQCPNHWQTQLCCSK